MSVFIIDVNIFFSIVVVKLKLYGAQANTTSTAARTSSENVTSRNHFSIIQTHYAWKMCSNYPGIDLFSVHVLFSHFRPRDATPWNSFFQMSSYARANVRITNKKTKGKFFFIITEIRKFVGFLLPSSTWLLELSINRELKEPRQRR